MLLEFIRAFELHWFFLIIVVIVGGWSVFEFVCDGRISWFR